MSQLILNDNTLGEFEHYYMNNMQLLANIIDPNMLFAEVARAGGKTEGVQSRATSRAGKSASAWRRRTSRSWPSLLRKMRRR